MQPVVSAGMFIIGALLAADSTTTGVAPGQDQPILPGPFDGGYTVVSGERSGKPIPAAELQGAVVRFTRGEVLGTDRDRHDFLAATYKLDTAKKPWSITMKSIAPEKSNVSGAAPKEPRTMPGLIKKEGNMVTLIYALPGGDPPTEFKTKVNQQMLVLKSFAARPVQPNKFEKGP